MMKKLRPTRHLFWLILFGLARPAEEMTIAGESPAVQFRRPVAIEVTNEGRQLVIANQRSGTISLIDVSEKKAIQEKLIGKRLSDLVATPDSQQFLVTDEEAHELIAIRRSQGDIRVEKRLPVSPFPANVKISSDGNKAYVASLWSRMITVVDLTSWLTGGDHDTPKIVRQIRLPFSPRKLLVLNPEDQQKRIPTLIKPALKLVVADAFGSRLAVIDPESGQIESIREIPAHAIRGLHLHPTKPQLMISHQLLSRLAQSTFDDVHWGNLMVNVLRSLDLSDLLDPKADLLNRSLLEYLGGPDRGAGDPGEFVMRSDGVVGVVLSGTDELILHDENHVYSGRVSTEHYPTAIAISPDGKQAFVLNALSDSVSLVQLSGPLLTGTISLGPQPELTPTDRGERLFHDARLSHDGWFSCASCHVDGHTNGLLNDNLTDGTFGTAKRVLTLRGIGETAPYAWTGRFKTLSEQITHSIRSTMQGESLTAKQTGDLEAYLTSLPPPPAAGSADKLAVGRGAAIFESQSCRNCHAQPVFTSANIVDVGLSDERGATQFNPPSLRGVSQNAPYFHDGRASSLEILFSKFRHQLDHDLSTQELSDLIAFLNDL